MPSSLAGRNILIVEDETMVAMLLEDIVEEMGCAIVGPTARVANALSTLSSATVDCAILDVNLNGESSYPIADALAAKGVPYIFVSGYGVTGLDDAYQRHPVVQKPFTRAVLEQALESAMLGSGTVSE